MGNIISSGKKGGVSSETTVLYSNVSAVKIPDADAANDPSIALLHYMNNRERSQQKFNLDTAASFRGFQEAVANTTADHEKRISSNEKKTEKNAQDIVGHDVRIAENRKQTLWNREVVMDHGDRIGELDESIDVLDEEMEECNKRVDSLEAKVEIFDEFKNQVQSKIKFESQFMDILGNAFSKAAIENKSCHNTCAATENKILTENAVVLEEAKDISKKRRRGHRGGNRRAKKKAKKQQEEEAATKKAAEEEAAANDEAGTEQMNIINDQTDPKNTTMVDSRTGKPTNGFKATGTLNPFDPRKNASASSTISG